MKTYNNDIQYDFCCIIVYLMTRKKKFPLGIIYIIFTGILLIEQNNARRRCHR
jgi:hypothetical protein